MKKEQEKKLTKAEQASIRRNQIIDTALKLFSEKGFGKTTIKDISVAAGTSMGLMYHYFASKDELLIAVFERHSFIDPMRNMLRVKDTKSMRDVLYNVTFSFYKLLSSKKELVNIVLNEMRINPSFNKSWSLLPMEGMKLLSEYLDAGIKGGVLRPHNTEEAARTMLYTAIMHFITRDFFPESELTTEQYLRQAIDIFLEGIAAHPQR